ncbi:MAG: NAD(+)/NADH kinase [Coriobacteriia bacterium]|nr:NAD(+)/NADH kinase [Coriobacteriia bacterium]
MRILVVINDKSAEALDASLMLATYFQSIGADYVTIISDDVPTFGPPAGCGLPVALRENPQFAEPFNLAVVLGGDGTILRAARIVASEGTPIMGLNFGHLGFLAGSGEAGVLASVAAALAGEAAEERRSNLRIDVYCEGDGDEDSPTLDRPIDPAKPQRSFFALNELNIARGSSGLIVDMDLTIAGEKIAFMRADGMVVSTATGSTAYALSAGGPMVSPRHRGLVVVPVAPHTLVSRAIVTAENDVVEIYLPSESNRSELSLFADGNLLPIDAPVKRVVVQKGAVETTLLRYKGSGFYRKASDVFFCDARCY